MSKSLKDMIMGRNIGVSKFKSIYEFDDKYHVFSLLRTRGRNMGNVVLCGDSSSFYVKDNKLSDYKLCGETISMISDHGHGVIVMIDNRTMIELAGEHQYKYRQDKYDRFKHIHRLYKKYKIVGKLICGN